MSCSAENCTCCHIETEAADQTCSPRTSPCHSMYQYQAYTDSKMPMRDPQTVKCQTKPTFTVTSLTDCCKTKTGVSHIHGGYPSCKSSKVVMQTITTITGLCGSKHYRYNFCHRFCWNVNQFGQYTTLTNLLRITQHNIYTRETRQFENKILLKFKCETHWEKTKQNKTETRKPCPTFVNLSIVCF